MAKVEIYTSMFCLYCYRAKAVLRGKGVDYTEIRVTARPERRKEMIARSDGRATVPQIFIDGRHIGGLGELAALERHDKLDQLLGMA